MTFSDRLLNITFKFAKVVSAVLAGILVLVFFASLAYALVQWKDGKATAMPDFDEAFNAGVEGNRAAADESRQNTAAENALKLDISSRYGTKLNASMSAAGCDKNDFDSAIEILVRIARNDDLAPHIDDVFDGAQDWFEAAAATDGVNTQWACGRQGYWGGAIESIQARSAAEEAATLEFLKGLGMAALTLIAAFLLMVIPAIYRIEESVRKS